MTTRLPVNWRGCCRVGRSGQPMFYTGQWRPTGAFTCRSQRIAAARGYIHNGSGVEARLPWHPKGPDLETVIPVLLDMLLHEARQRRRHKLVQELEALITERGRILRYWPERMAAVVFEITRLVAFACWAIGYYPRNGRTVWGAGVGFCVFKETLGPTMFVLGDQRREADSPRDTKKGRNLLGRFAGSSGASFSRAAINEAHSERQSPAKRVVDEVIRRSEEASTIPEPAEDGVCIVSLPPGSFIAEVLLGDGAARVPLPEVETVTPRSERSERETQEPEEPAHQPGLLIQGWAK